MDSFLTGHFHVLCRTIQHILPFHQFPSMGTDIDVDFGLSLDMILLVVHSCTKVKSGGNVIFSSTSLNTSLNAWISSLSGFKPEIPRQPLCHLKAYLKPKGKTTWSCHGQSYFNIHLNQWYCNSRVWLRSRNIKCPLIDCSWISSTLDHFSSRQPLSHLLRPGAGWGESDHIEVQLSNRERIGGGHSV